jgi:hypothetical protein
MDDFNGRRIFGGKFQIGFFGQIALRHGPGKTRLFRVVDLSVFVAIDLAEQLHDAVLPMMAEWQLLDVDVHP